ncbi:hypothetical protein V8E36_000364 [Tilletia maclaganii]
MAGPPGAVVKRVTPGTLSLSATIPLRQTNASAWLHPNGTLNHMSLDFQIHHIQHRYCLAQQNHHLCRQGFSSLYKRRTGQVSMNTRILGGAPTIPISIGGQALTVGFDTVALLSVVGPPRYLPEQSPSVEYVGPDYFVNLPDGRASRMARLNDIVSIDGLTVRSTFVLSEERLFRHSAPAVDGTLSFARCDLRSYIPASPIYEMRQGELLARAVFSFSFPRAGHFELPFQADGKLTIGAIEPSAYGGVIRYSHIESAPRYQNLWASHGSINGQESVMIFDTGSPFILVPKVLARVLFSRLNLWVEDFENSLIAKQWCASVPLTVITIKIGFRNTILLPSSLILSAENNGWCTLSVIGAEQEDITLGRPFFENVYTIMDLNGRVGLRKH